MPLHTRWMTGGIRGIWTSAILWILIAGAASGQDRDEGLPILWEMASGTRMERPWPAGVPTPSENAGWESRLMEWYFERAHFLARLDSARVDRGEVWVDPGPVVPVASIRSADEAPRWTPNMEEHIGQPATADRIESVVTDLLSEASRLGFLSASARVVSAEMGSEGLEVVIDLQTGPPVRLARILLEGDRRTRDSVVQAATGLRPGQSMAGVDLESVRSMLSSAGWHEQVLPGRFELLSDSAAVLILPVSPLPPGRFDLVVGALPGAQGQATRLVGSGHLILNNAFGQGRTVEANISRLPGQASSAMLSLESPAPGGLPLRVQASLQGHQQDSTWNQTRLGSRLLYRFDPTTWIGASFSANRTRAGFSGTDFVAGSQLVPQSSSRMGGLTLQVSRLDHPRLPRRGFRLESSFERGIRSARGLEAIDGDTLTVERSERRERLDLDLDVYLMSGRQLGWAAGISVRAIRAGRPDVSELLFIGGASSLRGYDENRFRGTAVGRAFVEGRWYVDRASWGFVFLDAGWVAVDADFETGLPAILSETEGWHPGYGFGFVFSSAVGPLSLSYALNPDIAFSEGRVHIGLSFGL